MITKTYNRIKQGILWVKNNPKKALLAVLGVGVVGLGMGVVGAAPLLRDPKIDINTYEIKPITFQNKQISFPCTDGQDHTGETVAIRTDDCDIVSWGGDSDNVYTYVAVSNLSQNDQNFQIQGFHSNGSEFVKFEEMKLQVPYQREVDDYSDVTYECAEGWEMTKEFSPMFRSYSCASLKEPKVCKSVEKTTCTVSEKTGSHSETYYVDELGSILKNPSPDSTLDLVSKKREDAKMVLKDQIQYWIPSGETKYFRTKLRFPKGKELRGKFTIKAFGSMGAVGSSDPSWYSASWGYRRAITVDYTKVATTTAITGFPLMFSTSTITDLKYTGSGGKVGKSDGTDILITASDGTTKLSHEIEKYSSSTGEIILWFNSGSTALSTSTNTSYYIYYGNSGASDQQDKTNVWDSNYKGVWHLPNGTTLTSLDSTSNANNSNAQSMTAASGQIDGSADGNGSSKDITIPSSSSLNVTNPITVQGWINSRSITTNNQPIISKGSGSQFRYLLATANSGRFALQLLTSGTSYVIYLGCDTARSSNTWYHVVATYDGSNGYCYVNGVQDGTNTGSGTNDGGGANDVKLGSASGLYLDGYIDEVRVSNSVRSAAWIKTEYNNQNSPNTFWSVGAEETAPVAGGDTTPYSKLQINQVIMDVKSKTILP